MSEPDETIEGVLRGAGISTSGIDRIKLGTGVVGKMTSTQMGLYVVCCAGIGGGIWLQNPTMIYVFGGIGFVSFVFSSVAGMWYATKHPAVALLEGVELVTYHQIDMAAKNIKIPASQPNTEPPRIDQAEERT